MSFEPVQQRLVELDRQLPVANGAQRQILQRLRAAGGLARLRSAAARAVLPQRPEAPFRVQELRQRDLAAWAVATDERLPITLHHERGASPRRQLEQEIGRASSL